MSKIVLKMVMLLGLAIMPLYSAMAEEPTAYVHFINVGKADAILVEFPCGTMLIDAGGEKKAPDQVTPYLDNFFAKRPQLNKRIDLVVITHSHRDHTKYLGKVLKKYDVRNMLWNGMTRGGQKHFKELIAADKGLKSRTISRRHIKFNGLTDQVIDPVACSNIDPVIRVLWGAVHKKPKKWEKKAFKDKNNSSIVVRVDFGKSSMLFTGDLVRPGIRQMMKKVDPNLLDVDLYKMDHHGFRNGTVPKFIRLISPEIAVMTRSNRPWYVGSYDIYEKLLHRTRKPVEIDVWKLEKGKKFRDYVRYDEDGNERKWGIDRGLQDKRVLNKAVYWTGVDGTVIVKATAGGDLSVIQP